MTASGVGRRAGCAAGSFTVQHLFATPIIAAAVEEREALWSAAHARATFRVQADKGIVMTWISSAALVACFMLAPLAASASSYTYITIAAPNSRSTFVEGLNKDGVVVGEYNTFDGFGNVMHGFVLSNGQYQTIDPPGSINTFIVDISDDGIIFGWFVTTSSSVAFAFTWKDGVYTILGRDGVDTAFTAVSRNGLAYGTSIDDATNEERLFSQKDLVTRSLGVTHDTCYFAGVNDEAVSTGTCAPSPAGNKRPFSAQDGTRTRIVIPFGSAIQPAGINNSRTIIGYYRDSRVNALRGFIDKAGAITVVADPDRKKTAVYGVNDAGDVIGAGSDQDFIDVSDDAFVYRDGVFTYLQPPAAPDSNISVTRINAAGQIIGDAFSYRFFTGTAYLATPVP